MRKILLCILLSLGVLASACGSDKGTEFPGLINPLTPTSGPGESATPGPSPTGTITPGAAATFTPTPLRRSTVTQPGLNILASSTLLVSEGSNFWADRRFPPADGNSVFKVIDSKVDLNTLISQKWLPEGNLQLQAVSFTDTFVIATFHPWRSTRGHSLEITQVSYELPRITQDGTLIPIVINVEAVERQPELGSAVEPAVSAAYSVYVVERPPKFSEPSTRRRLVEEGKTLVRFFVEAELGSEALNLRAN